MTAVTLRSLEDQIGGVWAPRRAGGHGTIALPVGCFLHHPLSGSQPDADVADIEHRVARCTGAGVEGSLAGMRSRRPQPILGSAAPPVSGVRA
jgi:hypothetical protein